ncbi:MAG: prolipoprotein diacylglyceryl transferase [Acidimicrobiales bacterium]|nr:prolipoprotein diacylglyceryl transferase [Acidimicrobiales bacterium]
MSLAGAIVGSIPSPSSGSLSLGPLDLRAYGLMIALGVVAAVWLAQRRWEGKGGDHDEIATVAMWAVPAGLIGARLYHVITDWQSYQGRWFDAVKIWEGGLGIPGGMALGVAVGLWVAHRRGIRIPVVLDAAVPALPLAQAIGRWGNWFNQELFGRPTELPWGLEIDPAHRPTDYADHATFHPTFLYESLWNLGLCLFLIWLNRTGRLRPGFLLAAYAGGYFLARLGIELLRVDPASLVLGVRINVWVSIVGLVTGLVLVVLGRRRAGEEVDERPYWNRPEVAVES